MVDPSSYFSFQPEPYKLVTKAVVCVILWEGAYKIFLAADWKE